MTIMSDNWIKKKALEEGMIEPFVDGQKKEAYDLNEHLKPLFKVLFLTSNPTPLKSALSLMGHDVGGLRLPLVSATSDEVNQIRQVLVQTGLL